MGTYHNQRNLSGRQAHTLKAVVERHASSGEPVGAKVLADMASFDLSVATLRNTLAMLTDEGYLEKSHSSSGRAPTDKGYRFYVDSLMDPFHLDTEEESNLRAASKPDDIRELAETLSSISRVLSDLSERVAFVGLSSWLAPPLKEIHFVRLSGLMVMAVMMTLGGETINRVVKVSEDYSQDLLERLSNYFNYRFNGMSINEIKSKLAKETLYLADRADLLTRLSLTMADAIDMADSDDTVIINGASNLIENSGADYFDSKKLRMTIEALSKESVLTTLLTKLLESDGVCYLIGHESNIEQFSHLSLVGSSFGAKSGIMGAVGIIGPKRMNYGRATSLVTMAAEKIGHRLTG